MNAVSNRATQNGTSHLPSLLRVAALGIFLISCPLIAAAQAPQGLVGTWKQNMAKSTYTTGTAPKSQTSHWEAAPGGGLKNVNDSVDAAGKALHSELVTMFDGKPAELKGAAAPTTRTFTRIDDRTYQFVQSVRGKVTTTTRGTISADGKTRTLVATGTDTEGKPVNNTTVWERQ